MNGESGGGGRHEAATRPMPGVGMSCGARCDECNATTYEGGRIKAKVLRGSLRGLVGRVCKACMALREKVAA